MYATVMQFREMMSQIPIGEREDALIETYLDRATAMIDGELGFAFAAFGAAATDQDFYRDTRHEPQYLTLPAYLAGSITAVNRLSGKGTAGEATEAITDYDELEDGCLYRQAGWPAGWYRATAKWGHGEAPADIQQVCLEKATNLFLGAQGGQFSDVVGIEGAGAVGYNRAWTNSQRAILQHTRLAHGMFGFA